eukprot:scaffold15646_cov112-Isochrysis_galbana.AAC.2
MQPTSVSAGGGPAYRASPAWAIFRLAGVIHARSGSSSPGKGTDSEKTSGGGAAGGGAAARRCSYSDSCKTKARLGCAHGRTACTCRNAAAGRNAGSPPASPSAPSAALRISQAHTTAADRDRPAAQCTSTRPPPATAAEIHPAHVSKWHRRLSSTESSACTTIQLSVRLAGQPGAGRPRGSRAMVRMCVMPAEERAGRLRAASMEPRYTPFATWQG